MCDYSLMELPSRLAEEGETLHVHAFPTGTKGLIGTPVPIRSFWQQVKDFFSNQPDSLPCAVCIPPGAQLTLHDIPTTLQKQFNVGATEHVTFTQLHAEAGYHRDAIRFRNGQTVTLQRLQPGQAVNVVRLALMEEEEEFAVAPYEASRAQTVGR